MGKNVSQAEKQMENLLLLEPHFAAVLTTSL